MNARLRVALVLAGVSVVALGGLACDAHKGEAEAPDEKFAARPEEPFASPPPRDLATLQRELAMQESELRRLGVLAEPEPEPEPEAAMQFEEEQAEALPDEKPADVPSGRADKGKKDSKKAEKKAGPKTSPAKAAGGVKTKDEPGAAPRPAADDGDAAAAEPGRTAVDEQDDSIEGTPAPEAAKSVQAPSRDQPNQQQLRAEERCPLICSLAENTCELAEEICTLAEQHGDDSEYSVACERASDDCKQAQEACLECHG